MQQRGWRKKPGVRGERDQETHPWGVFRHGGVEPIPHGGLIQTRNSRCGLRGVHIGEASHPGPLEVQNSVHPDDVHPTLLDDLERDLTPESTIPASSVVGHVNPLMVDLTMMDTASEALLRVFTRAVSALWRRSGIQLPLLMSCPTLFLSPMCRASWGRQ